MTFPPEPIRLFAHRCPGEVPAELRETVTLAAYECTAAFGVEGLRHRRVSTEAGVCESMVVDLYPTRRDLVAAVLDYIERELASAMRDDGTPAERLRHHLDAIGRMARDRPVLFAVRAEIDLGAWHDPLLRSVAEREECRWRMALAPLFRAGIGQGAWRAGVTEEGAVELVVAAVKGIRLAPQSAGAVVKQLEALLVRPMEEPALDRPA